MATSVTVNGTTYSVPAQGDSSWSGSSGVDGLLIALAGGTLQKAGGTFTLTAEANFGATYGLKAPYFKTATASPSNSGVIRLANNEGAAWRNAANSADLLLKVNASDLLEFNGNPLVTLALGAADTVLRMNAGGTAYEFAKITTNNIHASAGIVDTQLATIATAGKVSNSATTAASTNTASAIVARDGSGNFAAGTITASLAGNVTGNVTGNLTGNVTGNVTGDVTGNVSGSSGSTTGNAATVTTNANLTGDVTSVGNATTLATVPVAKGGTGQTDANAGFAALSPMTTNGDLITQAAGVPARLGVGTDGQVLGLVSGAPAWTDGGGGSGEKNYVTNPSAKSAITGWSSVGDLDVARTTTAADLPREFTTAAGIKITADANTQSVADYVYYDFTLDDVDLSKKLKIQWAQKTTGTYAAGDLAVVITTQADRTTALHTPITTAIPAADGVFTTSFDATTTATLSLVIRATTDMATNGGIVISDVVVGPGVGVQGAVVTSPQSYSPSFAGLGTVTNIAAVYWRVGTRLHVSGSATLGNVGSSPYSISIPTGLTIDFGGQSANMNVVGSVNQTTTASQSNSGNMSLLTTNSAVSTTAVLVSFHTASSLFTNTGTQTTSLPASFNFSVPIAEWAGSGTVNLAQNDVEYASNGATWDSSTDNFVYGPAGSTISGDLTTDRTKKVRFSSPAQVGDSFFLEILTSGDTKYQPMIGTVVTASAADRPITALNRQNSVNYGVGLYQTSGAASTDVTVFFGRYANMNNSSFGGAGDGWSIVTNAKWRVRKVSGGQAVGHGLADSTSSGLAPFGVFRAGEQGNLALQEKSATPSDPTSSAEAKIYLKSDKLVIQFNDAGTVRYKYLDLTGTGVTWVHTTSAP